MTLNEALIKVRDHLRTGTLPGGFNMDKACSDRPCGTIACIGGWAGLFMGMSHDEASDFVYEVGVDLYPLFYPGRVDYEKITPKQASQAIDNYLETGEPRWAEVLA